MTFLGASEYEQVIRLEATYDHDVLVPPGYIFVSDWKPVAARQYVRETTLARGRILYEVWNTWANAILGYACPEDILTEAKAYRPSSVLSLWPEEPGRARCSLQHNYDRVKHQFPLAPHVAAKAVAEHLSDRSRACPIKKRDVEDAVVEHVKLKWTSHGFRGLHMHQRPQEVEELVRPRVRDVLRSWLDEHARGDALIQLWDRHGLRESSDDREKKALDDLSFETCSLTWYAGKETLGNCRSVTHTML